jgi:D-sedoheptulose 7-phosphate isomerase
MAEAAVTPAILLKSLRDDSGKIGGALAAIALMDAAHITCAANDFGYNAIFSRSVEALGKKGDVLIALSTSGNSVNVREAIIKAKEIDMSTVALLGRDGGVTKGLSDYEILVVGQFSDRIQEVHMFILHIIDRTC